MFNYYRRLHVRSTECGATSTSAILFENSVTNPHGFNLILVQANFRRTQVNEMTNEDRAINYEFHVDLGVIGLHRDLDKQDCQYKERTAKAISIHLRINRSIL